MVYLFIWCIDGCYLTEERFINWLIINGKYINLALSLILSFVLFLDLWVFGSAAFLRICCSLFLHNKGNAVMRKQNLICAG